MRLILQLIVICALAAGAGLGLTWLAVRHPPSLETIVAGPWRAEATEGSPGVDAYTLAALAQRGEAPLAVADGLTFRAETDSDGNRLDGRCSYLVTGAMPTVRVWSISAYDERGNPLDNPAQRHGFTKGEAMKSESGDISIAVGASARGGDWIPTGSADRFMLILRVYDTTAGAIAGGRSTPELPAIRRTGCPA
ncbi:DUF1214 domain-containing protein [Flaviflagellibacter deserti]|uniref:DUF1214 domain-containing protein n=1 Tax=Flaviflagellibacter deserti TaxID=2267266 RepID=A0ABV9Z0Y9_9HYPH